MNYLAHARHVLDAPWEVAGTSLPDWLRGLPGRLRIPEGVAAAQFAHRDGARADLARGVVRHHADDRRFHTSESFRLARGELAGLLLRALPEAEGHRPRFVAHLLLEMLLDAELERSAPGSVERYYAALARIDPVRVEVLAGAIRGSPVPGLADLVERFRAAEFLRDYRADEGVLRRLRQVTARVRQPPLPEPLLALLPAARGLVADRREALLPGDPFRGN